MHAATHQQLVWNETNGLAGFVQKTFMPCDASNNLPMNRMSHYTKKMFRSQSKAFLVFFLVLILQVRCDLGCFGFCLPDTKHETQTGNEEAGPPCHHTDSHDASKPQDQSHSEPGCPRGAAIGEASNTVAKVTVTSVAFTAPNHVAITEQPQLLPNESENRRPQILPLPDTTLNLRI